MSAYGNVKPRPNGRNIIGEQLPSMLGVVASVCTSLKVWPVSNFARQLPPTCNRVCKRAQHVTFNNVASVFTGLKTSENAWELQRGNFVMTAVSRAVRLREGQLKELPLYMTTPKLVDSYNTRHKSWNVCVIFPFPNVDLGITVVSLVQNTRGSTLGKERGKFKWGRRCQEWI